MASSHDRAAKLIARKLGGKYNPGISPDVRSNRGCAEVKSSAGEIPKALRQLAGHRGAAFVVLPKPEHTKALKRLANRKTGLMDYQGNVKKPSARK
jgi:hypothetical protein